MRDSGSAVKPTLSQLQLHHHTLATTWAGGGARHHCSPHCTRALEWQLLPPRQKLPYMPDSNTGCRRVQASKMLRHHHHHPTKIQYNDANKRGWVEPCIWRGGGNSVRGSLHPTALRTRTKGAVEDAQRAEAPKFADLGQPTCLHAPERHAPDHGHDV